MLKRLWRKVDRGSKRVWRKVDRGAKRVWRNVKDGAKWVGRGIKWLPATGLTPVLVAWIVASRDATIRAGVESIPAQMKTTLAPHFSTKVLDSVRFRVGKGPWLALPRLGFTFGGATAMTLDHVIAFKEQDGANNAWLWAHECVHARQYKDWGLWKFSHRYLFQKSRVEREADDFANKHF